MQMYFVQCVILVSHIFARICTNRILLGKVVLPVTGHQVQQYFLEETFTMMKLSLEWGQG